MTVLTAALLSFAAGQRRRLPSGPARRRKRDKSFYVWIYAYINEPRFEAGKV